LNQKLHLLLPKDGKRKTPAGRKIGAKDLTLSKIPDEGIRRQIREGRKDRKGKVPMPSFKDSLSQEDNNSLADTYENFENNLETMERRITEGGMQPAICAKQKHHGFPLHKNKQ
jgi:hypothetical protein